MKKILLAAMMLMSLGAAAQTQQSDYDVSKDKENGAVVFKGQCSFEDLSAEPTFGWLKRGSDAYKPDTTAIKFLKEHLPKYRMVVLIGTWCDDSQLYLPRLHKILQLTNYPMSRYTMYGLDRSKQAKHIEHRLYKADKVPTIIVYKDHTEIGRIVETVNKSVEADLMKIIQKDVEPRS